MKYCRNCCVTCNAPIVTISGYTAPNPWANSEPGDGCNSCCWYRRFVNSSPQDTETNTCDNVCTNGSNSRWIVHRRIRPAAYIDVWVSKSVCACTPAPAGDKWFVSSSVVDAVDYFAWWNYGGLFGPVPTCFYPCPPVAATTPANCQWYFTNAAADYAYWTRTKLFTTYPTGNVSFSNSDRLSCLFNSATDKYDIPCFSGPFLETTANQSLTRNLVPLVNQAGCTGTYNVTTTFSPPTWTITFA